MVRFSSKRGAAHQYTLSGEVVPAHTVQRLDNAEFDDWHDAERFDDRVSRTLWARGRYAADPKAKLFYVIYVPHNDLGKCIDTIRFLANPHEKWRAHITVIGPRDTRLPRHEITDLENKLRGNKIVITGTGVFDNPKRKTVYFKCAASRLRVVWSKPDFGYAPHISIYDGPSREVADMIDSVVSRYKYCIPFKSDSLHLMVSSKGATNYELALSYDPPTVQAFAGVLPGHVAAREMPFQERLQIIDRICQYMAHISNRYV